ncbi:MAG: TetR/AcrR family transcriptional regulator [Cyanobacteria bacterium P01_A01_bin.37]
MSRQKNYERDAAIEKAKEAFWQYGYQSLGIRSIEEIVGIGRFAIRTDFGGKEGLFIEALRAYVEASLQYIVEPLGNAKSLDPFVDLVERLVTPTEGSLRCYGCLFINTAVENATLKNEAIAEVIEQFFSELRKAMGESLAQLQHDGLMRTDVSVDDAVEFIIGSIIAIHLMNRAKGDIEAGRGYANMAIKTVRSWQC